MENTEILLQKNKFVFKKKFGQNFLTDKNLIEKIVNATNVTKKSLVIEIGPGGASLTEILSKKAGSVFCYEIDKDLEPILKENLREEKNVKIIYDDFLKRDVKEDIKKENYDDLYIVANLPYYITTPIINKIIKEGLNPKQMALMVQKEVGDRLSAVPGTKQYGSLTVFLNYYFDIKKVVNVSRTAFKPSPNVDSVVVLFDEKEKKKLVSEDLFFRLVKDAFTFKRKILRNNLKSYNLVKIEEILNRHGLNLKVRAEQLSIDIYIEIANNL